MTIWFRPRSGKAGDVPSLARRTALAAVLVTTLAATSVSAQSTPSAAAAKPKRSAFLGDKLRYPPADSKADDFRYRTNAALALGQSDEDEAVEHLCRSLEMDPSEVVRQADAAALKRLGRTSALDCLKARSSSETSAAVRLQITRAIEALDAKRGEDGGGGASSGPWKPRQNPNAKYYVAISPITNNTDRTREEVSKVVLDAVRSKLESSGQFQVAPEDETPQVAKGVLSKRKLKGYYLSISVDGFDYSPAGLRVRMKCAVFTYPNRDLRGHFTPGATQEGVRKGDRSSENNLLGIVSGAVVDQFAQSVDQFAQAFR